MNILQPSPFLERLLRYLIPYFLGTSSGLDEARSEALETLASYGARTRAELLAAVQIIIFGLSALDALGEARNTEMSPSMRLRFRGCANTLSRSSEKTERILAKRLACDPPEATSAEPVNDLPEPQAEDILRQTQAQIETAQARASAQSPAAQSPAGQRPAAERPAAQCSPASPHPQSHPQSPEDRNKALWGSAMVQALADMGIPVQPIPPT